MINSSNICPSTYVVGSTSNVDQDEKLKDNNVLLCYMHAQRFEDFLERGLTLTRSDFFRKDDPFEAEFTEDIYTLAKCFTITNQNGKITPGLKSLKDQCEQIRKECFVSCWTKGPLENVALWRIYGKQDNAVAIKTNVDKLVLQLEHYIHNTTETKLALELCKKRIVEVEYIDHHEYEYGEKLFASMSTEILHLKNVGYKYENEVRVIFDTYQTAAAGRFGEKILIKVCPGEFIEEILVSPYACNCYFDSIGKLLMQYNLADKVKWSKLKYVPGENIQ